MGGGPAEKDSYSILLVEDEDAHAELIEMGFARSNPDFSVMRASTVAQARTLLESCECDLVLADWMLPDGQGLELMEQARDCDCPLVLMTSQGSEQVAVEALKSGALDYIVKSPTAFSEMHLSVQRALRAYDHIRERHEAEDRYSSLIENAPVGVYVTTPGGDLLSCNTEFARIYGYDSIEEFVADSWGTARYVDQDDRRRLLEELERGDGVRDFETQHRRRDGSIIWVTISCRGVLNSKGEIEQIEGFLVDVTERRRALEQIDQYQNSLERLVSERTRELERANQELTESRQRRENVIEFLPDATFVLDAEGRIQAWNQAMQELTGVPKEQVLGKGDHEHSLHLHGERRPDLANLIVSGLSDSFHGDMKDTEGTFRAEMYLEKVYGGKGGYLTIKVSPLLDSDGHVVGAIESLRDVTREKKAENALREQHTFLETLMDTIPSPVFYKDREGIYRQCNTAFAEHVRIDREDIVGKTDADIFGSASANVIVQKDEEVYAHSYGVVSYESKVLVGEDNREVLIRKAAHMDRDGRARGLVGVLLDITERKELERELIEARDLAEAASRAKSQFLATMSHEIRTPMNAILGMTDITMQTRLTPAQQENLQVVLDSANHLLLIINDILDTSKIESGNLVLEQIVFDLHDCLDSALRTFEVQAASKGIKLGMKRPEDLPRAVVGDPLRLKQVFINLLSNAVKFTLAGSIDLRVELAESPGPENAVLRFTVSDTGIGIPPDRLGAVFDSFSQADGSISRRFGGTGLGLSICRHLVALMGGNLEARSEPGQGSEFTFTISLPLGDESVLPELGPGRDGEPNRSERPRTVLLAEDNLFNAKVAVHYLNRMGHTVHMARNGAEAVRALERTPSDVVLMDLEMPGMDGLEASRRIRSGEAGQGMAGVPILALTAHALSEIRDKCLEAGMDGYVTKPVTFEGLFRALENLDSGFQASVREEPQEDLAVLDQEGFLMDMGGDEDLVLSFYGEFAKGLGLDLEALQTALETGDEAGAVKLAHKIKGGAGTARAGRLEAVARDMERVGREEGLQAMEPFRQELLAAAGDVLAAVKSQESLPEISLPDAEPESGKLGNVLVVDDDDFNRAVLVAHLRSKGYHLLEASGAKEALTRVGEADIVLLDVVMPGMSGIELCAAIRENYGPQELPVVMVTSLTDRQHRVEAVRAGANDFLIKPVDRTELIARVESLMSMRRAQDELARYQVELEQRVEVRTQALSLAVQNLTELQKNTVAANLESIHRLSAAAEFKDEDTANHVRRMSEYSGLLAEALGLREREVQLVRQASPMHDVGKIGVPDSILLKPGPLTDEEWVVMKRHCEFGAKILGPSNSELFQVAETIALTHHERWDGSGYPQGLKGSDIPLHGRICAVTDVFDALTSKRPYKEAFSPEKARAIMEEGRGTHFDPTILDLFFKHFDEVLAIKDTFPD